ncbi:MAG: DUF4175 domain-containing protein, partial [Akkermansiaceae bacterium]|nr:DUF4175 domain-containing protein [Akkermansiaceae bacterium]
MSTSPTSSVHAAVVSPHALLRRAGRALKLGRGLTLLAAGLVLAGTVLALWLVADARWRFGLAGRWAGLAAVLLPLLVALGLAARAVCRRLGDAALARRLELATGRDDNALVNAVQLEAVLAASPEWRGLALGELAGLWHGTAWHRVYDWRRLRRWAAAAGGLALCGGVVFLLQPSEFSQRVSRVLMPAREIAPVTATRVVEVFPGNQTVARGTSLVMGATLAGAAPDEVWLVVARDSGATERHAAVRDSAGVTWSVTRPWQESGRYWFEAGDARSFERRIEVRLPARIIARQLAFTPPAYTKLAPQSLAAGNPWPPIPQGSEVAITVTFDRDLKSLAVERDEAAVRPTGAPVTWMIAGRVADQRGWTARWTDALDLSDRARIEFAVKPDEAPRVRLIDPTGDEEILVTRDGWLRLAFEASDDYGLADVTVFRGSQEKPDARAVQSWNPRAAVFRQRAEIPLARWLEA